MRRVLVGTGAAAVSDSIRLSRHAAALGVAGLLLLPPFYFKPVTDAGLVAYVREVVHSLAEFSVPIYLYNFPALAGVPYTVRVVEQLLAEFGNRIAGLKDSSRDTLYAAQIGSLSKSLDLFGVSESNIPAVRSGALAGVVLGIGNIHARDCAEAYAHGNETALGRAKAIARIFDELPEVAAIKHLLSEIYGTPSLREVKPPLIKLTDEQNQTLQSRFKAVLQDNPSTNFG